MIYISASSLKDFMVCKHRYAFRRMKDKSWPLTVPLVKGKVVHDAIEKLETDVISEDDIADYLTRELMAGLSTPLIEFTKWDSIAKTLDSAKKMVATYIEKRKGVILENELSFKIDTHSCTGIPFRLVGRIDQIVERSKGICVVDLKTSRLLPTEFEIKGDYQFTVYAFAYESLYGKPPAALYNFHLASGKYIEYKRTEKDMDELVVLLDLMVTELDYRVGEGAWEEYNKSKGWHCNRCSYRYECYKWQS